MRDTVTSEKLLSSPISKTEALNVLNLQLHCNLMNTISWNVKKKWVILQSASNLHCRDLSIFAKFSGKCNKEMSLSSLVVKDEHREIISGHGAVSAVAKWPWFGWGCMDDGEGAMHTTTHTNTNTQQYNKRIYFRAACTDAQTNMGGGGHVLPTFLFH